MALLSQKASWRRADPVVARSDIGATAVSSASRQQGSSLAGQQASSSLDNPVSLVTSLVPSPSSDGIPASTTLPTTLAVKSTAPSPVTSIERSLQPVNGASSPVNVQPTISNFPSSLISTISYPDPTYLIVTNSPALSSSQPTVTTGSVAASTAPDILNVISPTSSTVQNTSTPPTSDTPSPPPNATSLVADTRSPLAPTTSLSGQLTQLTRTPLPSDEALSPSGASLPTVTSTSTDISPPISPVTTSTGNEISDSPSHIPKFSSVQSPSELPGGNAVGTSGVGGPTEVLGSTSSAIPASGVLLAATTGQIETTAILNITAATTPTLLPDKAPTPTSSSAESVTTTDGNSVESPTTSPGVPVDLSVSTSEATGSTSIPPTVSVASSSVAEILSSTTGTTLITATPSGTSSIDGDVSTSPAPGAIASVDSSSTSGPGSFDEVFQGETSSPGPAFLAASTGGTSTTSLVTVTTTVVTSSVVDESGTSSLIPLTTTLQTVVPTLVPASPAPPKRPLPIAAIAAPTSVIVIFIFLVLGIWCYRRRQHVHHASHHAFDFSQALEPHEESVSQSELPTFPTLLPTQGARGWNDPPAAAFASEEPAKDPFADPVSTNAFRPSVEPFNTRSIRRVSMADPFADPPVVMFSSQGEATSRLSKASWYDVRNAHASVTFSNVGRAV